MSATTQRRISDNGVRPITADSLNAHLESDGVVQISTYLKSTLYTKKHAGWFTSDATGAIFVRHGRGKNRLTLSNGHFCVAIRTGRYVAAE